MSSRRTIPVGFGGGRSAFGGSLVSVGQSDVVRVVRRELRRTKKSNGAYRFKISSETRKSATESFRWLTEMYTEMMSCHATTWF